MTQQNDDLKYQQAHPGKKRIDVPLPAPEGTPESEVDHRGSEGGVPLGDGPPPQSQPPDPIPPLCEGGAYDPARGTPTTGGPVSPSLPTPPPRPPSSKKSRMTY